MTTTATERCEQAPDTVIERLVELACLAPSVHNTQPWVWEYDGRRLSLCADLERQLLAEDPSGRNLTISCGAALHHLQFAASALGWSPTIDLLPEPGDVSVLARVVVGRNQPQPVQPDDIDLLRERSTDRRRFTAWPVPADRLDSLCRTALSWGVDAQPVTDDAARFRLEVLANQALTELGLDGRLQAEQDTWIGHSGSDGLLLDLLPGDPEPLHARSRFQPGLVEDTRLALRGSDRVIVLGGATDDVRGWLRTGQALSAAWLGATRQGLSVVPMSQPIEIDDIRTAIARDVLVGAFLPHVLVRVGWQSMGRRELPRTPRRPVLEVLRHVERAHPSVAVVPQPPPATPPEERSR